jgi:hypothetical protein
MKKLPENILRVNEDGQVISNSRAAFVQEFVKAHKVKAFKNEEGEIVKTPQDVVLELMKQHLNDDEGNFELPPEWENYSQVSDAVREHIQEHVKALDAQKKQKDAEKDQKKAEADAKKDAKEKEDKEYTESQESFASYMIKMKAKNDKKAAALFDSSIGAVDLPKTISFNSNGMGLTISENATKDDIAIATASIFGGFEGVSNAQTALQFSLGDLVNSAIKNKIFRSKGDATGAISLIVKEKLQKSLVAGSVNFYALMAERVAPQFRKQGVAPSVFLEASKIVAPRSKEASVTEQEALTAKFDKAREEAIQKIADGDLSSVKDVKEFVKEFKTANKLISGDTVTASQLHSTLFTALWIQRNLKPENDVYTFFKSKNSREEFTITVEKIGSTIESCMNGLQNMLMGKVNIPAVIAGKIVKGKGDDAEEQGFFLVDPFGEYAGYEPPAEEKKAE